MADGLDPRLNAVRDDIADARLEGRVPAARFVEGRLARVIWPIAPLRRRPGAEEPLETEALMGEVVRTYAAGEGCDGRWSWVQLEGDSYVGYLPSDALREDAAQPSHRVVAPRTLVFPEPDIKRPPTASLSMGASVAVVGEAADHNATYAALAQGGFVVAQHLAPLADAAPDAVSIAERLLGAPYLWGGKSMLGIDCSGLVQLSLQMAGIAAPRDADMQEQQLGTRLAGVEALQRGDLVFWKGHVGLMLDGTRLVHANAYHMMTEVEPLAVAVERFERKNVRVTSVRRLAGTREAAG